MTSIFRSFMEGYEGGQAQARQRRADNATRDASQRYQAVDPRGAESALMHEGLYAEASALGEMGERNRSRDNREHIRTQMTAAGDDPMARLRAGQSAAMERGEFDLAAQLQSMSADQLQQTVSEARLRAGVMGSLLELPREQRRAAALQIAQTHPAAGYSVEQVQNLPEEAFEDANLQQAMTQWSDIESQVNMRYQRERDQVEDQRWERSFRAEERHRGWERSRRGGGAISFSSASAFRGRYESEMGDLEDMRLTIETVEPFARDAASTAGRTSETDDGTIRTQDGVLLMTVARLAQGPGILSDQDVAMVQGTGVDASIAGAIGFINGEQMLSERQRYALSQVLLRRTSALEARMWQQHDEALEFARANDADPAQIGIRTPRVPRPDADAGDGGDRIPHGYSRPAMGGLTHGQVVDGQEYIGGDPDEAASWRRERAIYHEGGGRQRQTRQAPRLSGDPNNPNGVY